MPYYRETGELAPYAVSSPSPRGRAHEERFRDVRPDFERDRDRIIHCGAFRRLEYKTQVFINIEGDYYRTRLTHTIEAAQISRGVARRLGLNEALAEALALSHDMGHPPFGHAGEDVLDRLAAKAGGFEHNYQSLRIVEELEERYPNFPGLNLTWETREGILKHSHDKPIADTRRARVLEPGTVPTLEAQLIDLADEIAYLNHDVDDGIESGLVSEEQLIAEVPLWAQMLKEVKAEHGQVAGKQRRYNAISRLIGYLMHELVSHSEKLIQDSGVQSLDDVHAHGKILIGYPEEVNRARGQLKDFLMENLYMHPRVERMRIKCRKILEALFPVYLEHPRLLPEAYLSRSESQGIERAVCDYVAGMTDRFAMEEYKRLFEPMERV
ncbi:MAG: deoxyguanosinetriphosphate triphosphohydrolase [Chrysiogenetes bacterium]|nr:deoxyguanosinetriphosphate triphosphohydrolase [Chrysiogenetes bacterium]